jgi:hypothetical protein
MSDFGGLVDPYRLCSSPVLSGNFVPPGEYFGDSLRWATNPVSPTTSVRGGDYTPDTQGGPSSGSGKFVSLANNEFEMGTWNVSTPQSLPMGGRIPIATQVPHLGNDHVYYTPVSSDSLATYESPCSAGRGDVRHSGHRVQFEHASPPDTAVGA